MSTYPTSPRTAFVEWCEVQAPVFVAQETEIGLTRDQASAFAGATEKAANLLLEQEEARQRWLVASRKAREGLQLLRREAGASVRSIRAFAELQKEPNRIYAAAQVAPPATPGPAAAPGRPTRLTAALDATSGALALTWKARDPNRRGGVTYLIRRKLPGEAAFTLLGTTGKKTFVDEALPAGIEGVQYRVQSQRGEKSSPPSATLLVNIGKAAAPDDSRAPLRSSSARTSDRSAARGAAANGNATSQNSRTATRRGLARRADALAVC